METLREGWGQADQAGQDTGEAKVEDVKVARVAMSFLAWGIVSIIHRSNRGLHKPF